MSDLLVPRVAKHEETPKHKLHRLVGQHAAALRRLQGPETVCRQAHAAQGQPQHQEQNR